MDGLAPGDLSSNYLFHVSQVPSQQQTDYTLTINPSTDFFARDNEYALYAFVQCAGGTPHNNEGIRYKQATPTFKSYKSDGGSWVDETDDLAVFMSGKGDTDAWDSLSKFTMAAWVNVDDYEAKNGALLTLANSSEELAKLSVTSDKKAQGYIKDLGGGTRTLTAPRRLHPGYNLVTASYDSGVTGGVKLGVNGLVVATADAPAQNLFNQTLAVCLGAKKLPNKTVSEQLKNAAVDDAFCAKGVVTDADLWTIYTAYLTAAPLMQVADVTPA